MRFMKLYRTYSLSILLFCLTLSTLLKAAPTTITYFQDDFRYTYEIELLQMALDKTEAQYGPAAAVSFTQQVNEARGLRLLELGKVDVAFVPTNREREIRFEAVKFPLVAGLLGYRVFLINKENQKRFSNIHSLAALRSSMIAGFGVHWADMQILSANQLPVIGNANYEELFDMLQQDRFDYFPRGVNEAWLEVEKFSTDFPNMTVEKHLALYYPFPRYFFVNKEDKHLAKRLLKGLQIAQEDGSFKKHFMETFGNWIEKADLKNRRVFILNNPFLNDDTPRPDTSLWLPNANIQDEE
jgi:hypothetical protein